MASGKPGPVSCIRGRATKQESATNIAVYELKHRAFDPDSSSATAYNPAIHEFYIAYVRTALICNDANTIIFDKAAIHKQGRFLQYIRY